MDNELENRDVKEFSFRQLCKVRVGPKPTSTSTRASLLATCNKFGLVFAAYDEGFKVIRTVDLCQTNEHRKDKNKPIEDLSFWSVVKTPGPPSHIALSHDDLTLSVCCHKNDLLVAELYDVCAFSCQGCTAKPMFEVQLTNNKGDNILDLQWNPGFPNIFATCLSDGTVELWDVKRGSNVNKIATAPLQVTSLFWSPKGKQIVLAQRNGFLVQVDHQLQPKREIPKPQEFPARHHITDILWITTFSFAVVHQIDDKSEQPNLTIITAPKQGQATCLKCEDICYGQDEEREPKYYMFFLAQWGILIAASANSTETGILGRKPTNNDLFDMWILDDAARASCPSTEDYTDTYPSGMAVDFTSQTPIRISDENIQPPSPILMLLSTDGVLLPFYMLNSHPGAPTVVKAPEMMPSITKQITTSAKDTTLSNAFTLQSRLPQGQNSQAVNPSPAFPQTQPSSLLFTGQSALVSAQSSIPQQTTTSAKDTTVKINAFTLQSRLPQGQKNNSNLQVLNPPPALPQTQPPAQLFNGQSTLISAPKFQSSIPQPSEPKVSMLPALNNGSDKGKSMLISSSKFVTSQPESSVPVQPKVSTSSPQPVSKFQTQSPVSTRPKAQNPIQQTAALTPKLTNQSARPIQKEKAISLSQTKADHEKATKTDMTQTILDEVSHFQRELHDLKERTSKCTGIVGSKDELTTMHKEMKDIIGFSNELKENIQVNSSEICEFKTKCLDLYTMMEEYQILQLRNEDPSYANLLRSRPLDPDSIKKKTEIQSLLAYIESSIQELNMQLDSEWENHEEMISVRGRRLQPPTSDDIYRTLKNNHNTIVNQKKLIEKLTSDLQSLKHQPFNYATGFSSK